MSQDQKSALPLFQLSYKGEKAVGKRLNFVNKALSPFESWTETSLDKIDNFGQIIEFFVITD